VRAEFIFNVSDNENAPDGPITQPMDLNNDRHLSQLRKTMYK